MITQINKKTGQMSISIPKALVEAWGIEVGEEMDFTMLDDLTIYLTRVNKLPTCKDGQHIARMKVLKDRLNALNI